MKKTIYLLSALLLSSFVFIACEKEDLTKPTIKINEPTEDKVITAGGKLHVDANLSDDVELKSYKINIHSAFDGHVHASKLQKSVTHEDEGEAFSFLETYSDAAGKKDHHLHLDIEIPEDAAEGEYHLIISLIDKAGNESSAARGFIVEHDEE